jgi:integrase/ribosomal protein S27AE
MAGLTPEDSIFGGKASSNDGKSSSTEDAGTSPLCPRCGSTKVYRDGLRRLADGSKIQRWLCGTCSYRFTDKPSQKNQEWSINTPDALLSRRQICATIEEAKNLEPQPKIKTVAGESPQLDCKGKIVEFSFWMLKEAYSQSTIKSRTKAVKRLMKLGADINNPESIKETIAKQQWSTARKCIVVDAYTSFLQMQGRKWDPPIYHRIRKLPFIPTENEADQLIGGCNKRMATFLQLLKETGIRCGEATQLKWTDIDSVDGSILVTPEKGSNSRKIKISNKLVAMINELPKNSKLVFNANTDALRKSFQHQRRHIAHKLQNPRLLQISFHTFRHWKATMEYHKTRDILHVMQLLGHRSIQNTLVYTRLINFKDDEYTARIAHSEQEACQLIESGFEFVCDFNGNKLFRKRK